MEYTTWTIDQLLGMAPDHLQVSAAETVALPEKWSTLGVSDGCAWGEFINNKQVPYRVVIALPEMGLSCDCPSRKRPCRHSISLSLLLAQRPNLFSPAPTPQWAASLLALPTPRTENQSPATTATALDQALATYQRRLGYVKAGMNELALWLRDMVHHGMAALVPKNALYWRQMADRLVDAQAYETAKEIRQLATMPGSRPDWPQQLLRRSGRLYLLTQGFARYDSFLPELQADMRFAVGWFPDPGSGWSETQRDTWLVVGKRHELLGRKNLLRVWLWGI